MKLIGATIENFKRIKVVNLKINATVTKIAGGNEQGKSCVLDALCALFGGAAQTALEPVRRGTDKATVTAELDDYIVTGTWKPDGKPNITVKRKDGFKADSPVTFLKALTGNRSLDPGAFFRLTGPERIAELKRITGLDFTALDQDRKTQYDTRTEWNREAKSLKARIEAMPKHDAPAEEPRRQQLINALDQVKDRFSVIRLAGTEGVADMPEGWNVLEVGTPRLSLDITKQAASEIVADVRG